MTILPTPWTVGLRRWSQSGRDAHGNPVQEHAAPVAVAVHAVYPRVAEEPEEPNRWQTREGLTVLAPAGTVVGEHDRVVWPFVVDDAGAVLLAGDEFEVDGHVGDWTKGPWAHPTAGVSFDLTRVEG